MMEKNNLDFKKNTIITNAQDYLNNLTEKSILVCSRTAVNNLNLHNSQIKKLTINELPNNVNYIDEYAKMYSDYDLIISLGGGSIIDAGQYLAFNLNKKFVAIPSALTTNAYSTNSIVLFDGNKKRTIKAFLPDVIVYDKKLIQSAKVLNLMGLADALSIYTACNDWILAQELNNEKIDNNVFNQAQEILKDVLIFINNNTIPQMLNNTDYMFSIIGRAGYITNIFGCGRPESGSEHIFASALECNIKIPHGIAVAIGIVIMSIAQDKVNCDINNALIKLGIFDYFIKYGINRKLIDTVLKNIQPRLDRFTIVNNFDFVNNNNKVINQFEKLIKELPKG